MTPKVEPVQRGAKNTAATATKIMRICALREKKDENLIFGGDLLRVRGGDVHEDCVIIIAHVGVNIITRGKLVILSYGKRGADNLSATCEGLPEPAE